MALPIAAGAAASMLPSAYQFIQGILQRRKGDNINAVNPGFQMNNNVIDNARILGSRYGNYQLPGYNKALNDINTNAAIGLNAGIQGASSSGDVLDMASKIAYGSNQATNNLATQSAQGQEAALMQYLNANAQAGQQYQDKNAYDRQVYQQQLAEKAALYQGGTENIFKSLDNAANLGSSLLTSGMLGGNGGRRATEVYNPMTPIIRTQIPSNTDYRNILQQRINLGI